MRYLENAIKFIIKYWILALPLFVLTALAYIFAGRSTFSAVNLLSPYLNTGLLRGIPSWLYSSMDTVMPGGGFWLFIFKFIAIPVTYGLINKNLETGSAGLGDIGQTLGQNIVKYVMFFIGSLLLGLAAVIAIFIVSFILGIILGLLGGFGAVLLTLVSIAIALAIIAAVVLLSLWFSAMVVDGLDVAAAAKKSFEIVKSSFWTVLGITLLVGIVLGIAGFILNFLSFIPLMGPIIASIAPVAKTFVMAVFLLTLYREKTGRTNIA